MDPREHDEEPIPNTEPALDTALSEEGRRTDPFVEQFRKGDVEVHDDDGDYG
jgi:hypothetical protein